MIGWGPVVGSLNQMLDHGLVVPETIVGMSTAVIQSGIGHRPYASTWKIGTGRRRPKRPGLPIFRGP
jgi:hypothetical protein